MSVQTEIDEIIKRRYNNYEPEGFKALSSLHLAIRASLGDEKFLIFLQDAERTNPRPKYSTPDINLKVSAAEKAMQDPRYIPWLHELTTLGYSQGVTIESDHAECVGFLFIDGKTPEEALPEYIEFKKRWKALNP